MARRLLTKPRTIREDLYWQLNILPNIKMRFNSLSKHGICKVSPVLICFSTAMIVMLGAATKLEAAQMPASNGQTPDAQNEATPAGGFVPGQKRPTADKAIVAHGKLLFGVNCRGCHGADLRGGDLGGPNLLRSQVALTDKNGELIIPIIQGSRQKMGMPAIGLNEADSSAVAAYVRSVVGMIQEQGAPPSVGRQVPSILVGNAGEGAAYFSTKCAGCHSASNDLKQIGSRITDPKRLQNVWLSGFLPQDDRTHETKSPPPLTATVSLPSGETLQGQLVRQDDFLVTIKLGDGTEKTLRRAGDSPSVKIDDPLKAHRDLLPQYSDKDIHDVTAYLVTLK